MQLVLRISPIIHHTVYTATSPPDQSLCESRHGFQIASFLSVHGRSYTIRLLVSIRSNVDYTTRFSIKPIQLRTNRARAPETRRDRASNNSTDKTAPYGGGTRLNPIQRDTSTRYMFIPVQTPERCAQAMSVSMIGTPGCTSAPGMKCPRGGSASGSGSEKFSPHMFTSVSFSILPYRSVRARASGHDHEEGAGWWLTCKRDAFSRFGQDGAVSGGGRVSRHAVKTMSKADVPDEGYLRLQEHDGIPLVGINGGSQEPYEHASGHEPAHLHATANIRRSTSETQQLEEHARRAAGRVA